MLVWLFGPEIAPNGVNSNIFNAFFVRSIEIPVESVLSPNEKTMTMDIVTPDASSAAIIGCH